ncbi:hypothetical protein DFH08DRAFT_812756 [Mycena albidolilacea]|uniref:Uncharacterized protein n=1 Tax=Mycena albidolilacea TaxID=1033008 RepID=A0AAD6ZU24_9AGAR|nr:hypothetical protein DFH08DRAFT_812756 [Mycena albidolilacea]
MEPVWMTPEEAEKRHWGKERIPPAVDLETGIPEAKTQSSEMQDFSEPGLKDVESGKLQKSAEAAIERVRFFGGDIREFSDLPTHFWDLHAVLQVIVKDISHSPLAVTSDPDYIQLRTLFTAAAVAQQERTVLELGRKEADTLSPTINSFLRDSTCLCNRGGYNTLRHCLSWNQLHLKWQHSVASCATQTRICEWFRHSLNLEPEPAFRFGLAFEHVRTWQDCGHLGEQENIAMVCNPDFWLKHLVHGCTPA